MASTKAAQRTETIAEPAMNKGEVVPFQPARLPYHPAIEERFGIDRAGWNALVGAVWPSAKTVDSVAMALSYCRARNLDPFKRPVHIVPMWSSALGDYTDTVWPGIAELRTTAFRTGQYAGCDETEFGPRIEKEFTGRIKSKDEWINGTKVKGTWKDTAVTVSFPQWARITVYRDLNGRACKFVGPKVLWTEAYATIGASDIPNEMWQSRTDGQLEKCAEAAALRKAFPEEIGNQLTAEEMEGRHLIEAREAVIEPPTPPVVPLQAPIEPPTEAPGTPAERATADAQQRVVWEDDGERPATAADQPEPPKPAPAPKPNPYPAPTGDGLDVPEFLDAKKRAAKPAAAKADAKPDAKPVKAADPKAAEPSPEAEKVDEEQWLRDLSGAVSGCEDLSELHEVQKKVQHPMRSKVTSDAWAKGKGIVLARSAVLFGDDD
jgi:phage recombination protein Bet